MDIVPFDLNLRHLRALSAVAAHGGLSAAAQAIGLSQPALTQGLGKLERQVGQSLFERRPDGMIPTEAGRVMADRSSAAFAYLATAMRGSRGGRGFSRPEQLVTATQLAAFLRLADAGSFAGAAAASGLSQPALHRAVRDLEQVCGTVLAERRGRGMTLTPAGRRVARGVRLAAGEIRAALVTLADVEGKGVGGPGAGGRIVIGAMPLSRALVLPHAFAAFLADRPRAVIEVIEGSWRELAEPLRDGVIDLMVGALRDEAPPGLAQCPLFDDRLMVVGRAGHPLAGRDPAIEELASYEWIAGPPGTPLRARWEGLFAGRFPVAAPIECGSVMVIRGVLARSDLLTLLSPDQVALELGSGMLATIGMPIVGGVRSIGITTRVDWRPTAAQARLISLIEQAARETRVQESE